MRELCICQVLGRELEPHPVFLCLQIVPQLRVRQDGPLRVQSDEEREQAALALCAFPREAQEEEHRRRAFATVLARGRKQPRQP